MDRHKWDDLRLSCQGHGRCWKHGHRVLKIYGKTVLGAGGMDAWAIGKPSVNPSRLWCNFRGCEKTFLVNRESYIVGYCISGNLTISGFFLFRRGDRRFHWTARSPCGGSWLSVEMLFSPQCRCCSRRLAPELRIGIWKRSEWRPNTQRRRSSLPTIVGEIGGESRNLGMPVMNQNGVEVSSQIDWVDHGKNVSSPRLEHRKRSRRPASQYPPPSASVSPITSEWLRSLTVQGPPRDIPRPLLLLTPSSC
jgi:hypothetical protein